MEGGKEGRDKGRATEGKGRRVQRAEAGGRERGLGQDATGYGSRAGAGGTNEAKGESETSPPLEAEDNFSPPQHQLCVRCSVPWFGFATLRRGDGGGKEKAIFGA